jgi:antitoxin PrlF
MSEPAPVSRTCSVSRKGQTTLPLAVRQILGVRDGGEIVVRTDGRRVIIEAVEVEHRDPAIGAFLRLITDDIATGRHVGTLPEDLLQTLKDALQDIEVDLDAPIEGDVCL